MVVDIVEERLTKVGTSVQGGNPEGPEQAFWPNSLRA